MISSIFSPDQIETFWENNPCGNDFIEFEDWKNFFINYDSFKERNEPHIFEELEKIDFKGKRVLEIGLGQGTEAQKIIQAGAVYNGIDFTEESIERMKIRCELFSLPYESLHVMNAENLDFPDESFDIVFSHGVLHHSPHIRKIINEIFRVLKKNGMVVVMLYHKNSINYHISIKFIRRLGIFLLFIPGISKLVSKITKEDPGRLEKHIINLRRAGLSYLKMKNFIHKSTDGPENVFSSIFSRNEAKRLFSKFRDLSYSIHFLNERHLPIVRNIFPAAFKKRMDSKYGWHLWIKGIK